MSLRSQQAPVYLPTGPRILKSKLYPAFSRQLSLQPHLAD